MKLRKGILGIIVALCVGFLGMEFFIVRNLIYKHEIYRRIGMEQEYLNALNDIEYFKRFLPPIVNFSYCETKSVDSFEDKVRSCLLYTSPSPRD